MGERPVMDGKLNDPCWLSGNWAGDFIQWIPNEGANPAFPTYMKILYDDKNIYVALRAVDYEPEKIQRLPSKRDEFAGDVMGICFDSYHDYRTGFEFYVTAFGQQYDGILSNPWNGNPNWNAVWQAKSNTEDTAWTVEMEIPLNQLRFSDAVNQVWGLHCWRRIARLQEESTWEYQSLTGPGMLYLFGNLLGIEGIQKTRHIELMPFVLGKLHTYEKTPNNPFNRSGRNVYGNIGLDANIGLSSNFTVDLTINPDFGQVESDPSVINLSAFETHFEEKRPFFMEGMNFFDFGFDHTNVFYSRRIGDSPSFIPELIENQYARMPDYNRIIDAEKLNGKTSKGLSVGLLHSFTDKEYATLNIEGINQKVVVEPFTNYMVVSIRQDFNKGNTTIGGIATSVNRSINNSNLMFLSQDAYTGGLELFHQWKDKEYYLNTKIVASQIKGSKNAISELQLTSARYFQRPDHYRFDSKRTILSGFGGNVKIGKGSKGRWRYSTEISWYSPGLELNDVGFLNKVDMFNQNNTLSYFINQPTDYFRKFSIEVNQFNNWDFDFNHLASGIELNGDFELLNKWNASFMSAYKSEFMDQSILRGGHSMLIPANYDARLTLGTDRSKKTIFKLNSHFSTSAKTSFQYFSSNPGITVRPFKVIKVSLDMNFSSTKNEIQFIDQALFDGYPRYVLGTINMKTAALTLRIDYNITPKLSIQFYGSPFASTGVYDDFKQVTNPTATDFSNRYMHLEGNAKKGNVYLIDENLDNIIDYTFSDPDFNFFQYRSNLVFRWEFKPGSNIYLVWSNERTDNISPDEYTLYDTFNRLSIVHPVNYFQIKFNYWFSL
jgi:hypothetical protein